MNENKVYNYKHLVEIDLSSANKETINKGFDRLINDSPLTGQTSHYIDEKKNKLYLSFQHMSSVPTARLKTILNDFKISKAKHTVFDNIRQNEISTGKISKGKKLNISLSKGISVKNIINSDKKTYITIQNHPNTDFNTIKNDFDSITSKANQVENTLFNNPDRIKDLSEFNKLKLNSFINNFSELTKNENIVKLQEVFKPHEVLTNNNVIEQINKNNLQNIHNMVVMGYQAPEQLIDNINKSTAISDDRKVALFSALKPNQKIEETMGYKTDNSTSAAVEKNIEIKTPSIDKGKGLSM